MSAVVGTYAEKDATLPLLSFEDCMQLRREYREAKASGQGGEQIVLLTGYPPLRVDQIPYHQDAVLASRV